MYWMDVRYAEVRARVEYPTHLWFAARARRFYPDFMF